MLAREVIQRVREIQVHTGRQVADVLAGQYVSVFKGRGIEFDEVREYIRHLQEDRELAWGSVDVAICGIKAPCSTRLYNTSNQGSFSPLTMI